MKHTSFKRILRSLLALVLALAIPFNAFAATLTLPAALKTVAAQAFKDNTAVDEIVLPEGTKTIDSQAFAGCTALLRAVIPASVDYIADDAFDGVSDALFIDAPFDSYAAAWAREHGYQTNEPEPPADPAELVEHAFWPVQYVNMAGVNWVADLYVENYELREGEELIWSVERMDGNSTFPAILVNDAVGERGLFAGLHMYKFTGETGSMTWRVTVASSMGDFSLFRDYDIEVIEAPSDFSFEVGVPEEDVYLNAGETYTASANDLFFVGNVPEGAQTFFCVMSGELDGYPTLNDTETGFEVTINEPGDYSYLVSGTINGVESFKEVCLHVVAAEPAELVEHAFWPVQYVNMAGVNWVADLYVENYELREGEELIWSVERLDDNSTFPAILVNDAVGERGLFAGLHMYKFTGETGSMTWRVTVASSMGDFSLFRDYDIEVIEAPSDFSFEVGVPEEDVYLNAGETYTASANDLFFVGNVPEGAQTFFCVMSGELDGYPTLNDTETGFEVTINEPGDYSYLVSGTINGVEIFKEVCLHVVAAEPTELVELVFWPTQYINMGGTNWVADLYVENYELREGEELYWDFDYIGTNTGLPAEPVIDVVDDGGRFAGMHMINFTGEIGQIRLRVTVQSNMGDFSLSRDYTITVGDRPNVPTDILVPEEVVHLNVGETYAASAKDLAFADGDLPYWDQPLFFVMPGELGDDPTFKHTEDGFEITISEPGRYSYLVSGAVNGLELFKEVYLVVGDGMPADVSIHADQAVHTAYANANSETDVGSYNVENFFLLPGEKPEWTLERIDENTGNSITFYTHDPYDDGQGVHVSAYGINDVLGSVTYRLTFTTNYGVEVSADITLEVVSLPENLPSDISVPETEYILEVGDVVELYYDDIVFTDGSVPEDARLIRDYWGLDSIPGVEWLDEGGARITFTEDGRHAATAVAIINNVPYYKDIYFIVGDGVSAETEIVLHQEVSTIYVNGDSDFYIGDASLDLPVYFPGEEVSWEFETLGGDEDVFTITLDDPYNDGFGINLNGHFSGEETGEFSFLLKAITNKGLTVTAPLTISVAEPPADLPTAIRLAQDTYELEPGEYIYFGYADIEFADGRLPEGAAFGVAYSGVDELAEQGADVLWMEYGFEAAFEQEGTYTFEALAWLNNIPYRTQITLVVGGTAEEAFIHADQVIDTVFANTTSSAYVGSFEVRNLTLQPGETGEWSITREDQSPVTPFELSLDDEYNDGLGINISATRIGDIHGTATYRLTYTTSSGVELYTDITLSVAQRPENLPSELSLPNTAYYLAPGDTVDLFFEDIGFADGYVPSWVSVVRDYWGLDTLPQTELIDGGVRLLFPEEGRYQITAYAGICNYSLFRDIEFVVGNPAYLSVSQDINTVYTHGSREFYVGSIYAINLALEDGEAVSHWEYEQVWEGVTSPLALELIPNFNGKRLTINGQLAGDATGEFKYLISLITTYGRSLSAELAINVSDPTEELPTAIDVKQDIFRLDPGKSAFIGDDDIFFADGIIPAGSKHGYSYDFSSITQHGDILWTDGGVMISFENDGIYTIYATAFIDNVSYQKEITFIVGDAVFEDAYISIEVDLLNYYAGGEDIWPAASLEVMGYPMAEGEQYDWSLEMIEGADPLPAQLRLEVPENGGLCVDLTAFGVGGETGSETGSVTYRVTFTTENGLELSTELTLNVTPLPENIPTDITVPETEYILEAGDVVELYYDDITFTDGEVPEGAHVDYFYMALDDIPVVEWMENGVRLTFTEDGRYRACVAAEINNYNYYGWIYFTVGTDLPPEASLRVHDEHLTSFIGGEDNMYAASVEVINHSLQEGDWYEWYIEPVDNTVSAPVELRVEEEFDDGLFVNLTAYNIGGQSGTETGTVTYRVLFAAGNSLTLSTELTLNVVPLPEDMPTAITVPQTEYTLDAGDTLELTFDQIGLADGVLPEDVQAFYHYWNLGTLPNYQWTDDGFIAQFDGDGRYTIDAALRIGNYVLTQPIYITVGSGIGNARIASYQEYATIYPDNANNDIYLGSFHLENYRLMPSEKYEWTLERIDDSENPAAALVIYDVFDDGHAVDLGVRTLGDHTGSVTYRLTFTSDAGASLCTDVTVNVVPRPENLPTALALPATEYRLDIGDSVQLYYNDIVPANGKLPGDAVIHRNYGINYNHLPDADWNAEGMLLTAHQNARYYVDATLQINNISVVQPILIICGTGVPQNVSFRSYLKSTKLYTEGDSNSYLGWFRLDNYEVTEGEDYEWTLTQLGDDPNPPVRLRITDEYNNGNNVDIGYSSLTGETGSVTYRLTFTSEYGVEASEDITIEVVNTPDTLPTDLIVPAASYQLDVGETLFLAYEDIEPADGELPEDAEIRYDYGISSDDANALWTEEGLRISYPYDGRFYVEAVLFINNYTLFKEIVITVGSGISQNVRIVGEARMDTLWLDCDEEVYMGSFWLNGYRLMPNEKYQWTIAPVAEEPAQPAILEVWGEYDSGHSVDIGASIPQDGPLDERTYRLTFTSETGVEASTDITVAVTEAPDNLPTALTVPATAYQLDAGDILTLLYDDIGIANGVIPEDVFVLRDYGMNGMLDAHWYDDGVDITFPSNGRYQVDARLEINNHVTVQPIIVTVGDGMPENLTIESNQNIFTVYATASSVAYVGTFHLNGYEPLQGEEYEWKLEYLGDPENAVGQMEIWGEWGSGLDVGLYGLTGETGSISYRLTFSQGELEASTVITIEAVETPDGLPTSLSIPAEAYTLEAGDTLLLRYDDIRFEGGAIPEDAYVYMDYGTSSEEGYTVDWRDDGLLITFPNNGSFHLDAIGRINNYELLHPIHVRVGTGYSDDAALTWSQEIHTLFIDGGEDHPWMGSAMLEGYHVYDGDSVEWTLERIDGGSGAPVEIYVQTYDDVYAEVCFENIRETGSASYRLTATAASGFTDSCEFSIAVEELPDNLPTDIELQTFYQLGTDEWMTFDYGSVGFTDGEVPEDANIRVLLNNFGAVEDNGIVEWHENGFSARFAQEGRYEFNVAVQINNYTLCKDVVIQAGEAPEPELTIWRVYDTHYISDNVHWLGDANLQNLHFEEDGHVEWSIVCTDENPLAELFVEPVWDNGLNAGFRMTNFTGETGVLNFIITAQVDDEWSLDYEGSVTIEAKPDDLPSGIDLVDEIEADVNEPITILAEDISFTQDGIVPEGADVFTEFFVSEDLLSYHGFEWVDGGFTVTFSEGGRYLFTVASSINGVDYTKDVLFVVDGGVSDTAHLHVEQFFDTHYINGSEQWLADVHLRDHNLYDMDDVLWKIECLDEDPLAEVFVSDVWDDQRSAGFRIHSFTGETGSFNYRVSLYVNGELLLSHDDCVQLADMPDNLPSNVRMPYEEVWLDVGETYAVSTAEISFKDDGVIPEDAKVFYEFYTYEFDWLDGFMRLDDGFEMTFDESGRYPFYAVGNINGVEFIKEIRLIIGEGYSSQAIVGSHQYFVDVYAAEDESYEVVIGHADLYNYLLFENERIEWTIERTDNYGGDPVTLSIQELDDEPYWVNIVASGFTGETSAVTYEVTAQAPNGFKDSCEFFIRVVEKPDNLPTQLLLPEGYEDLHFEVGDEFVLNEHDLTFSEDGVVPEDATIFYDIYDTTREVFHDQDFGWGVNGGFAVWFQREGRYELPVSVIISGYRLSRTMHITVGDGMNDDAHIDLQHDITPIYLGGEEVLVGTIRVQNYSLFEGEYIQWDYTPVPTEENGLPLLSIDEEGFWDENGYWNGTYGIRVTDFNEAGETTYDITATLPTGQELHEQFTLVVQPMPENLPTEIAVPEESYTLFDGDSLTLYMDEFGFANGEIPEDAFVGFTVWDYYWPEAENYEQPPMSWFTDEDGREGVTIESAGPGSYAFHVCAMVGNYRIIRTVPVTFVQGGSIAILTTDEMENEEAFIGAIKAAEHLGHNRVQIVNYPEDYYENHEQTAEIIETLAEDLNVEAIIVSPAAPGTAEGMRRAAEAREDVLLIAGSPMEDNAEIAAAADIVLSSDDTEQAIPLIAKCVEWDVDVLVHFSFPRHMEVERIKARHDLMAALAEEAGIEFIDAVFTDTMDGGLEAARNSITEQTYALAEQYSDQRIAFFATNCGVQSVLQRTVLECENAYYPQPCCPSPFHGFAESLALDLDLYDSEDALEKIANELNRYEAAGRFSTWPAPIMMGIVEVAAEYGMGFAEDHISERCSMKILTELFSSAFGDVTVSNPEYDNVFTLSMSSVDFNDHVTNTVSKIAVLTASGVLNAEDYAAAMHIQETYGEDRVIVETYPNDFMEETEATAAIIAALASEPDVKAIIASQALPGTVDGFSAAREIDEDVLLIACAPQEDMADMVSAADFVMHASENGQAEAIMDQLAIWGVDTLVHFSFPRHMELDEIKSRLNGLKALAEENGIGILEVEIPDPATDFEYARAYTEEMTHALAAKHSDQKIAFFATNCGMQAAVQAAVLACENAYYPLPCCPSPFHGFAETLGLELDLADPDGALTQVADALAEHGALNRFSTWAAPINMGVAETAAAYAMAYADGDISDRNNSDALYELLTAQFEGAEISSPDYDNLYAVRLSCINFEDYLSHHPKEIRLWVSESIAELTEQQIVDFKDHYPEYADWRITLDTVGEGDAADQILGGDTSADLFVFAQDQLARLATADCLAAVPEENALRICEEHDAAAAAAVQFDDVFYAYPVTSDNGYFLYYDSNVVSDPSSLERILADCEAAGKTMNMELSSGWYQPAFFFGAGCELSYTFDADGSVTACSADYASDKGLRALKAMVALEESRSYENISIAADAENIGAIVTGTWDASILQNLLGDGYAAVKLPTADGFQLSGFGGFKMLGVKPQQTEERTAACAALAMYMSDERAQNERFETVGWGPSNKVVQQSEAVQNDVALSALADQMQYAVPQGQYPGEYWSIAENFGRRLLAGEFSGLSDNELMAVLEEYQAQLTGLVETH